VTHVTKRIENNGVTMTTGNNEKLKTMTHTMATGVLDTIDALHLLPPISIEVIASKVTKALVVIVGLIVPSFLLFRVVTAMLLFSCLHCYLTHVHTGTASFQVVYK
jgi:hypothetical protein